MRQRNKCNFEEEREKMGRKKWLLTAAGLVIVIGACSGFWLWSGKSGKPLQAAFSTVQVRKGSLDVKISGTGNIEAAQRQTIKASSSGKIAEVKVKQGDKVKKGQVLATFEQSDTTGATSQIRSKQLDLEKKKLDLQTLMDQFKQAPDDDKRAELSINIQKQQLDIESTQADIQSLKADDSSLDPITAPIDGTLATFSIAKGDTIGGQAGTNGSLGEVVDYDHLQMVVGVDELDIPKVKKDQETTVLVEALPDETFTGKVTEIAEEGTASNGVSSFNVTLALNEVKNLKVGMSAEASILVQQKADALYLPIEAVQSFGGRYFVMVPSAGGSGNSGSTDQTAQQQQQGQSASGQRQRQGQSQGTNGAQGGQGTRSWSGNSTRQNRQSATLASSGLRRVSVQVGIHNEDYIEIASGLKEGESVVIPAAASSTSQSRSGAAGIPGFGIGGGAGLQGGGFGGGNRQFNGGTRQSVGGNQGGGSRG
jgi:HlyD family secretion protein